MRVFAGVFCVFMLLFGGAAGDGTTKSQNAPANSDDRHFVPPEIKPPKIVPVRPAASPGFGGRGSGHRKAMLASGGGTRASEVAVAAALNWLVRHQSPDGSWSIDRYAAHCHDKTCSDGGDVHSDAAATGLALLPFLATGGNHRTAGPFRPVVKAGIKWLVEHQRPDGDLAAADTHKVFAHGVATMALCECYGLSGDDALREPAQKAVRFILNTQSKDGSWDYTPHVPANLCAVAWQMQALKTAEMAGLEIEARKFKRLTDFLNGTITPRCASRTPPTETAIRLLCQQYQGMSRDDPVMVDGQKLLGRNLPTDSAADIHYWYFGTAVMHNMPGYESDTWNRKYRRMMIESQCMREGDCDHGSWKPDATIMGRHGGRLMATCLGSMSLTVYYAWRPLYQLKSRLNVPGDAEKMQH
jgi:hypothetical protein